MKRNAVLLIGTTERQTFYKCFSFFTLDLNRTFSQALNWFIFAKPHWSGQNRHFSRDLAVFNNVYFLKS